ncbi:peptidylprolyl isomerase [Allosphingosinicella flava]|uniref:Peptidyl-prolyl cis-trans isomerase n=1 Tax=Allosphingosinicella flava TaxID=2771430 RepID=A0A7T2GLG3_9SPHN|nr:peptidylprolyl isomerase [Sphingosinicella flava]QPQ56053.1 peptidylprolyl isomerase [Sphingosinicella flava]
MRFKSAFALIVAAAFAGPLAAQTISSPVPREASAGTAAMTEAAAAEATAAKAQALLVTPALDPENTLYLDLSTGGRVSVQLRPDIAPNHVERIKTLARQGFYNGLLFHRVIEGFMAQTGDPRGTGEGGSPLPDLEAEFNGLPHVRGAVSMARANAENSANSQFFIMLAPRLGLDNKYTVFGRVVSGMQYVDAIQRGEPPVNPSKIVRASIGADNVPPPSAAELAAAAQPAAPAPAPEPAPAPQN